MPIEITPNYIRVRVANPKQFVRFRVKILGKGIRAVIGFRKKGGSQIQSLLFPRKRFTVKQVRAWIKSHGFTIQESYLVKEILIDPKTNELYFEETVVDLSELEKTEKKPKIDVKEISKELFGWLVE